VKDEKRKLMLAMLSAEDDAIGRLLETLRKHQLEENTLIFFHSDNGGPTAGNGSRNTPLSGYKGQVWEGGIRIPFLMQWKGHIKGGNVIDQPVIALDIFPTACAAAGASVPSDRVMDGLDLMPLVHGQSDAKVHDTLYWRFGPQAAMRSGDLKLVKFEGQPDRLFDLSKDIAEKEDLAATKPDVLKEMQAKYEKWNKQLKPPLWEGKGKQLENRLEEDSQQQRKAGGNGKRRGK
jgi:arylsulfatase A-like enzyme